MIKRIFIIIAVIAFAGLIQFPAEAEASDLEKVFSGSLASTAVPGTAHLNSKELAGERIGEFSKGYQKWQTYVSAAGFDKGKGEMYALHLGYGYFFMDDFSINIDVLGSYIRSGIDDNGVAAGLDVIFRHHPFKGHDNLWSLYLDVGAGLQQQSTNFAGSRKFNFRLLGGGGATFRVAENVRLMAGMRYLHISDAGIEGGGGGFDGFQFYAGSTFPF
jgi:opacity protein-like surface antigen